jgi:hypothetical protein
MFDDSFQLPAWFAVVLGGGLLVAAGFALGRSAAGVGLRRPAKSAPADAVPFVATPVRRVEAPASAQQFATAPTRNLVEEAKTTVYPRIPAFATYEGVKTALYNLQDLIKAQDASDVRPEDRR